MTTFQKTVKYIAMAFAIFLAVGIIGGLLGMVGLFGGLFGSDGVADNMETYSVSSKINKLKVEINAANLIIKDGDSISVESNLKHLTIEEKNDELYLRETKKFMNNYNGATLILYLPTDTFFKSANITTGAGRLEISRLAAEKINLELGAGEVVINSITATSRINIDGGAGKITVSGGELNDLDMDMGVGQLNFTSALTGKCEFDLGVGESNITVLGQKDDYKLSIDKGIGSITVDGVSASSISRMGNGDNSIKINGGVGAINLRFE